MMKPNRTVSACQAFCVICYRYDKTIDKYDTTTIEYSLQLLSFPRKRESSTTAFISAIPWIPACAGMAGKRKAFRLATVFAGFYSK
ncbi:MAG: hypothetical protein AAGA27_00395 [Pseudomonadota bacterium]